MISSHSRLQRAKYAGSACAKQDDDADKPLHELLLA